MKDAEPINERHEFILHLFILQETFVQFCMSSVTLFILLALH